MYGACRCPRPAIHARNNITLQFLILNITKELRVCTSIPPHFRNLRRDKYRAVHTLQSFLKKIRNGSEQCMRSYPVEYTHIIVQVLDRIGISALPRVVGHTSTAAVSGAPPWATASLTSCTRKSNHTLTSSGRVITLSAVGAVHNPMGCVCTSCLVAPGESGCASAFRAIAPAPAYPAVTSSEAPPTRKGNKEKRDEFDAC